jgi:hypothetical protein
MLENFRRFEVTDPFGQTWQVEFLWIQNAITIRHADAVDVKFIVYSQGTKMTKVVALYHPWLLEISQEAGRPITDPWCCRLAALHLRTMLETWQDMEKTLVSPTREELERYESMLEQGVKKAG